jgi:hypothetical protein
MGSLSTPAIYRASLTGDQATMKRRLGGVEWKKVGRLTALRCRRDVEKRMKVSCAGTRTKEEDLAGEIRTRSIAAQRNELSPPADWAFSGEFCVL